MQAKATAADPRRTGYGFEPLMFFGLDPFFTSKSVTRRRSTMLKESSGLKTITVLPLGAEASHSCAAP